METHGGFVAYTNPNFTEASMGSPPIEAFSVSNPNKKEFMNKMAVMSLPATPSNYDLGNKAKLIVCWDITYAAQLVVSVQL